MNMGANWWLVESPQLVLSNEGYMMPKIINPEDIHEEHSKEGWSVRTVADASHIGMKSTVVKWWTFQPNATGPQHTRGQADEILYVIQGTGQAIVDGETFELDEESVLWVEEGEIYSFTAGENGLQILQGYAEQETQHG